MASLNKVMLIGNIGNAPDCRTMPNGDPVAHFRLATSEGWTDRTTRERKEHTEWHSIVCYRQQADFVRDYLGKGRQVYIEGKLRTDEYEKDGVKRWSTKIIADEMQMLGGKEGGGGGSGEGSSGGGYSRERGPARGPQSAPARSAPAAPAAGSDNFDEDEIPF